MAPYIFLPRIIFKNLTAGAAGLLFTMRGGPGRTAVEGQAVRCSAWCFTSPVNQLACLIIDMGVSWNRGTSKSSILVGFSGINHPFGGTPIHGNTWYVRTILPVQGRRRKRTWVLVVGWRKNRRDSFTFAGNNDSFPLILPETQPLNLFGTFWKNAVCFARVMPLSPDIIFSFSVVTGWLRRQFPPYCLHTLLTGPVFRYPGCRGIFAAVKDGKKLLVEAQHHGHSRSKKRHFYAVPGFNMLYSSTFCHVCLHIYIYYRHGNVLDGKWYGWLCQYSTCFLETRAPCVFLCVSKLVLLGTSLILETSWNGAASGAGLEAIMRRSGCFWRVLGISYQYPVTDLGKLYISTWIETYWVKCHERSEPLHQNGHMSSVQKPCRLIISIS